MARLSRFPANAAITARLSPVEQFDLQLNRPTYHRLDNRLEFWNFSSRRANPSPAAFPRRRLIPANSWQCKILNHIAAVTRWAFCSLDRERLALELRAE